MASSEHSFWADQADRFARSKEVRDGYHIEFVGSQSWIVVHPDEPERAYLVDLINMECSCIDFHAYCREKGLQCKHLLAVVPSWEELTGLRLQDGRTETLAEYNARYEEAHRVENMQFKVYDDPFAAD